MNPESTFAVATAPRRDSRHWTAGTVTWQDLLDWAAAPSTRKECGNYLLGTLRETPVVHKKGEEPCTALHRNKKAVVSRSAITLDVDHASPAFLEDFEMVWGHAALVHTTWNSTPDSPRYRMILPTDRALAPDEYIAAARTLMAQLGEEQFDPGSSEAERYMFKPAAADPAVYRSLVLSGAPLPVDALLENFEDDLSTKPMPAPGRNKRDPFSIEGVIGLFNQAYEDWDLLIETYDLPYEKVDEDRYHLVGARSQAGMGPVAGTLGLVYSHHANDPAFGKTCSAFDLVRIHLSGDLDERAAPGTPVNRLPSQEEMLRTANDDERVARLRAAGAGSDFTGPLPADALDDLLDDANAWKIGLTYTPKTNKMRDDVRNWDLIVENDPVFALFRFNELTMATEVFGSLPWRPVADHNRALTASDRAEVAWYLEREYGLRPPRTLVDSLIDPWAARRPVNPVRDYLEGLTWDGVPRVETCLPGVRDTPEHRLIARKVMVAAVARVFDPGCKWDHTLVLYGSEGLGKSWWIEHMARGYSASLGDITNKDTLLALQRSWIVVSDEGHSLRRADADAQKEFLTRTHDLVRLPYERDTILFPRRCVIWSTTNDETFLSRQEGNRRFLIVHCEEAVDFDAITDEYIGQVWAEAVAMYRGGESLYLDREESRLMAEERVRFTEEDSLSGIIEEYLEQLVPEDWWERGVEGRKQWMADRALGFVPEGTQRITATCSTQIWVEALGQRLGDQRRTHLLDIFRAIKSLPGWRAVPGRHRLPGYGPQVTFEREEEDPL